MDTTIDQQVAMDDALVPHARRLRIGRSNFCLLSDIASKESTLQLVYDVMRLTLFFKAFLVTADVLEIHMQEFWATATVHHHSIRFKMDNKKHIVNLESFREIGAIRRLTDVNINKLHQPWRSFAAIINKCLTGKSSGYDSLRSFAAIINKCLTGKSSGYDRLQLSQAQILWGLYHKRNVDFAYLIWEDFIYQVKHKDTKKSNEMYYPRNSNAYKEYYAVATSPKPKASVRKTRSSSDTTVTPLTAIAGPRLEEGQDEEDEADELYRDININLGRGIQIVAPFPVSAPTLTPSTIATITTTLHAPTPPKIAPSTVLQDLANFGSLFGFDHRQKTLKANFFEFMQTNQFAGAVSSIPGIVHRYMDQRMNEAVKVAIQL
nr:hypothetical protein [Tanacetum cinerariifolium]